MSLVMVIATGCDRYEQAKKARSAYRRETPGQPIFVIEAGRDTRHAWERALDRVPFHKAELIHFTTDTLEPHPGWLKAARADGHRIAAPVIWTSQGEPVGGSL